MKRKSSTILLRRLKTDLVENDPSLVEVGIGRRKKHILMKRCTQMQLFMKNPQWKRLKGGKHEDYSDETTLSKKNNSPFKISMRRATAISPPKKVFRLNGSEAGSCLEAAIESDGGTILHTLILENKLEEE
jgi:hypothetical protein